MGVRYSAADSALLIQALTNNVTTANQVSDRLASGCDHLMSALDSGELQGAAYTAGRGLFSDIIIPSIQKLQEAIDDIQAELTSYIAADGVVSEFGSLDLDQLKQIKELRHKQWENVSNQIAENQSFFSQAGALLSGKLANLWQETFALQEILNNIEDHIRELDDKIEKLQWFVGQVSRLFIDSLAVLNFAIKGASQLSQVIVDSNGGYSVQGLDMSWVEQMKNAKIKTYTSKREEKETQKKHLLQKIKEIKNSDGSVETKVNEIIKAYENYLYQLNKEAIDEYWKKRKSYGDKWDPNNNKMAEVIERIEQELSEKLQASGIDINELTAKMGTDILEVTGQDGWNYLQFKNLVDTGQPMDLKSRQYSDDLPFSIWSRKWTSDLKGDYLGNYLYGYAGQGMLAVDGDLLKYAAGGAQLGSDVSKYGLFGSIDKYTDSMYTGSYGDNLEDTQMIQDGIEDYKQKHGFFKKNAGDVENEEGGS